jgi:hypothetical protein
MAEDDCLGLGYVYLGIDTAISRERYDCGHRTAVLPFCLVNRFQALFDFLVAGNSDHADRLVLYQETHS